MVGQVTEPSDADDEQSGPGEVFVSRVYNELRHIAACQLANENPGQTLGATALVHEAWLRLAHTQGREFNDAHHFFSAAAKAMRHIIIDNARRKKAVIHGGNLHRTTLGDVAPAELVPSDDLIALDEALAQLAEVSPDAARLVELRFFAGFQHQESATIMGLTRGQADDLWAYARAWLYDAVNENLSAMHA